MNGSNDNELHYVYKNNPVELKNYVNKEVEVKTNAGTSHRGVVYTVDPVSGSVILLQFQEGRSANLEMILGQSVKEIRIDGPTTDEHSMQLDSMFQSRVSFMSTVEISKRKEDVKSWLLKNRIPLKELEGSGVLCIMDSLQIHPPYLEQNCFSANEIILGKVQKLLQIMP